MESVTRTERLASEQERKQKAYIIGRQVAPVGAAFSPGVACLVLRDQMEALRKEITQRRTADGGIDALLDDIDAELAAIGLNAVLYNKVVNEKAAEERTRHIKRAAHQHELQAQYDREAVLYSHRSKTY